MNSVYRIFSDRYGVKYTEDELIQCIDYFTYSEKRTPFIFTLKDYNINNDVIYNLLLQASFHVTINLCKTSKSAYKIASSVFWEEKCLLHFGKVDVLTKKWKRFYYHVINEDIYIYKSVNPCQLIVTGIIGIYDLDVVTSV